MHLPLPALVIPPALLLLGGCASTVTVEATRIDGAPRPVTYRLVSLVPESDSGSEVNRRVVELLTTALNAKGLREGTGEPAMADMAIFYDYGVRVSDVARSTSLEPAERRVRIPATTQTYETVNPSTGQTTTTVVQIPERWGTEMDSRSVDTTIVTYEVFLSLRALLIRGAGGPEERNVWSVTASIETANEGVSGGSARRRRTVPQTEKSVFRDGASVGPGSAADLRDSLPLLVATAAAHIDTETNGKRKLPVDRRAQQPSN